MKPIEPHLFSRRRVRVAILKLIALIALALLLWCGVLWRWHPTAETFAPLPDMDADNPLAAFTPPTAPADVAALRRDAEAALLRPVLSITDKSRRAPSGDARDYVSLSIYWWPNPVTHLPYIHHDGRRNPEVDDFDAPQLKRSQTVTLPP